MGSRSLVLGFDPGYDRLGYCVLGVPPQGREGLKVIDFGIITVQRRKGSQWQHVLLEIYKDLQYLFSLQHIIGVGVEEIFLGQNVSSVINVAKIIGLIELLAIRRKIQILRVNPRKMKYFISKNGRATKSSVKISLEKALGIKFSDAVVDDAIDAIGIAYYTYLTLRGVL